MKVPRYPPHKVITTNTNYYYISNIIDEYNINIAFSFNVYKRNVYKKKLLHDWNLMVLLYNVRRNCLAYMRREARDDWISYLERATRY